MTSCVIEQCVVRMNGVYSIQQRQLLHSRILFPCRKRTSITEHPQHSHPAAVWSRKERKAPVIGECRCDSATNTGIQHREDDQDDSELIRDIISSHDLYIVLISMALLDKHLRPMAKFLGVPRYASKNKKWLFFELASRMLARKWVSITGE